MISLRLKKSTNHARKIARSIADRKQQLLTEFAMDVKREAAAIQPEGEQSSLPGQPPVVHSPAPNLETVEHSIDGDSVIVGPALLPGKGHSPALPGVMERGGVVRSIVRSRRGQRYVIQRYIRRRPYMAPSFAKAMQKLERSMRRGFNGK